MSPVSGSMTVRVNGAVWLVEPTVSWSPEGLVLKLRSTVFGFRFTVVVPVSPPESVAVSTRWRYEGYVIGRGERATGHSVEGREEVHVAHGGGGAVLQEYLPGQRRVR